MVIVVAKSSHCSIASERNHLYSLEVFRVASPYLYAILTQNFDVCDVMRDEIMIYFHYWHYRVNFLPICLTLLRQFSLKWVITFDAFIDCLPIADRVQYVMSVYRAYILSPFRPSNRRMPPPLYFSDIALWHKKARPRLMHLTHDSFHFYFIAHCRIDEITFTKAAYWAASRALLLMQIE